ncbi:ATP-binding cassette domain-containing protein [Streptomyces sp. SID5785]|uniref:ATP-binding cassette domain-containing protein n=1 Tax=Streptomyces sp. SID5785 TaxID=2690309 RepID=UPI001360E2E1|nr:ATP-binding cassette domain-containing protein [Streptomyces sp. SID5785]MZD10375.1 ATP-binding cassette domain-containing protein [Streptomyces sp. SID5785]
MIQAIGLTSNARKEGPPAVDDVSFEAHGGRITALLGPRGAGKTTAVRLMLELQQGRGVTYFRGRPLHRIPHPAREVGVLLGDVPGHPARSVRGQLRMLCAVAGVPAQRADEVLEAVGLVSLRDQRLGTLSRGMDRRLGLAAALLADPHTLVLDGPSNGLSPRERTWLHGALRAYADLGGTVLFTSDDAKEVARAADHVVTLDAGKVLADQKAGDFARTRLRPRVAVRSPHAARLGALLAKEARMAKRTVEVVAEDGSRLSVYGSTCADVGETAFRHGILVHQLADETGDAGPQKGAAAPIASPTDHGQPADPAGRPAGPERGDQGDRTARNAQPDAAAHGDGAEPGRPAAPVDGGLTPPPQGTHGPRSIAPDNPEAQSAEHGGESIFVPLDDGRRKLSPAKTPGASERRGEISAGREKTSPGALRRPETPTLSPLPPPVTVRSARSPLRPFRYEVRRATGVPTGYVTAGLALVMSAILSVFLARAGHTPQSRLLAAWPHELPLPPAAVGAGLLGAFSFGDEFRHPALAADRGTVPRRLGLLTAKLAVGAATAMILATLVVGCDAALLHLVYGPELTQVPTDWISLSVNWIVLLVACAWAGVLASGVFRSTTAGLAAVVAVPVVIVPLVQKAMEGPSVRTAAGLPGRLQGLTLVHWPFGAERYVAGGVRMIAQPVGGALMLSLTALLCAYVLTVVRPRVR